MTIAIETLEKLGVFVVGGVVRVGIFLAVIAALMVPVLAAAGAIQWLGNRRRRALGLRSVSGVTLRPGVHYAPGHTWLAGRGAGGVAIGLDDLGLRLLPSVTAVEPVRTGTHVRRGDPLVQLWGGGRKVAVRAPFDGVVAGVNAAVIRDPSLVKSDGYDRGWLVAVEPVDDTWTRLPEGETADRWIASEARRWNGLLEERLGIAAADGGELVSPAPWLLGEEGWRSMVEAFLDA
jgi:glycine cleavage system H protein